jgi:hypothetical protein
MNPTETATSIPPDLAAEFQNIAVELVHQARDQA